MSYSFGDPSALCAPLPLFGLECWSVGNYPLLPTVMGALLLMRVHPSVRHSVVPSPPEGHIESGSFSHDSFVFLFVITR